MPSELIFVVAAVHEGDYRLQLQFSDGLTKTVDFSRWLHGKVFEPMRNVDEFKRFFVSGGTVCWPNGADIAPETLHTAKNASATAA